MTPGSVADFLNRRGETVTITRPSDGTYSLTTKAYVRLYQPKDLAGGIIQGDREVRMPAYGIASPPQKNDRVMIGGKTTTVQFVWPAKIGEDAAVYVLQVRG